MVFFLSACSFYAHATPDLGATDCSLKGSAFCDIFLKTDRNIDDVSYKVELADSKTGDEIFPYSDMNETMESVSLQKYGERYVFLKEYLDTTKALEFITFKYINKLPSSVRYYYIESSVNFNKKIKEWSGKECDTSAGEIPATKGASLLQASSELCVNKTKLAYSPNKQVGSDIFFYLSQVTNGDERKQIPVIALDRKDTDAISINDIGCLSECDKYSGSVNYIGKLDQKYRVGLHLEDNNGDISGFYFYEKTKKKINLTGHREGERLTLSASVPDGIETFDGVLDQGQFKGLWSNAAGNKKYPFAFYVMLIQ